MIATDLLDLLPARSGHFLLESGYHTDTWLSLETLFADPRRVAPLVTALAGALRPYRADVICGAMVGGAFLAQGLAPILNAMFCYTELVAGTPATGPFTARYRLPAALRPFVASSRVVVVDDVMSAGSSVRATTAAVEEAGGLPVAVGAFLVLGDVGLTYCASRGLPVAALGRRAFHVWPPAECPLCAEGHELVDPGA